MTAPASTQRPPRSVAQNGGGRGGVVRWGGKAVDVRRAKTVTRPECCNWRACFFVSENVSNQNIFVSLS